MARRAAADIVEVEGSHVIMISQPQAVTDLIVTAAGSLAAQTPGKADSSVRPDLRERAGVADQLPGGRGVRRACDH